MALSLERLLDDGFTRDDIMKLADSGAFNAQAPEGSNDDEPKDEPKDEVKDEPKDANTALLSMMSQMMENQNKLLLSMMEQKKTEPEPDPEPSAEEKARKFSDEQLVKALQSLNILKEGDKIDIGSTVEKNIEDKILGKLGMAVGFTVDKKDK